MASKTTIRYERRTRLYCLTAYWFGQPALTEYFVSRKEADRNRVGILSRCIPF